MIFGDILDVHELTANLLSSLEDTVEATEENNIPLVGTCFAELIEVCTLSLVIAMYSGRCVLFHLSEPYTQVGVYSLTCQSHVLW